MFKLDEVHLDAAKQIAVTHRKKKSCSLCYDRGWIGVNDENLLITCSKCVDLEAAMEDWKTYVTGHEDLKEHFAELFEDVPAEEIEKGHDKAMPHDLKKAMPKQQQNTFVPGQKRTGLKKV